MAQETVQIVVWNVAHGSAIYVKTPNGRSILLDAGSSDDFSPARWLNAQHGLSILDLFVLSHPHEGHVRDIENVHSLLAPTALLRNSSVPRHVIHPIDPPQDDALRYYAAFDALYPFSEDGAADEEPEHQSREAWGGLWVKPFFNDAREHAFDSLNNYSVATFLEYGNLTFLFPGDLEGPGWQALMKNLDFHILSLPSRHNDNQIRILVASQHGHTAGLHLPFLHRYKPHLTIISGPRGDSHMAYSSYAECSSGLDVLDRRLGQAQTRWVLTPRTNEFVLITSDSATVQVLV